ncbi:Lysophospholipase L1 [Chitinophaga terrae (ex Kim and Jung 2007)]|uniref:Lysophospholipase L1 n=2 Tax=Chitinophaga terrae (ex Kim and Jung 2007) TaxID=408074 RepID=A0A1H4E4W2_9BACT|nr:Lysophospholipase L1 [Chitinophaga terrae (ex Kim and Jung 2007)]
MLGIILFCLSLSTPLFMKPITYLALGDSYTIGEAVPASASFPVQAADMLRATGININQPDIVAVTGWTTDELAAGIAGATLHPPYDLVTLLIGVNNQYRGRPLDEYKAEFTALLQQAIHFSGNRPQAVVVLSIPDWGVTPFAADRDRQKISREIDVFNAANKEIAAGFKTRYLDITAFTREAAADPSLVAEDGLHPSGKDYQRWAQALIPMFLTAL